VNSRLICATHRDLRKRVEQGAFREDVFYRANVVHLRIPPLRERPKDILWYARRFLREVALQNGCAPRVLSSGGEKALHIISRKNLWERLRRLGLSGPARSQARDRRAANGIMETPRRRIGIVRPNRRRFRSKGENYLAGVQQAVAAVAETLSSLALGAQQPVAWLLPQAAAAAAGASASAPNNGIDPNDRKLSHATP